MNNSLQDRLKKNLLPLSVAFILIVIIFNTLSVLRHRYLIMESKSINNDVIKINQGLKQLEANIFLVDIGLRGFLLKQDEAFLDPYNVALPRYEQDLFDLESVLLKYNYPKEEIAPAIEAVQNYISHVKWMVELCKNGEVGEAFQEFEKDYGKTAWEAYGPFIIDVQSFTSTLHESSEEKYNAYVRYSLVIQIVFILISIPVLIFTLMYIIKTRKERTSLIHELQESNNQYVFNDGITKQEVNETHVISDLIKNLKQASLFIKNLAKGNFEVQWKGIDENNKMLNEGNLSGELLSMRDQLKKIKAEDDKRNWFNTGLSKFSDVIRENQNTLKELSDNFISDITKYTNSRQGSLFLVETDPDTDMEYLEIKGMYAYDRKKYVNKRVESSSGLVGQCYMEGETIYLTNVPGDYMHITSGLGEAKPDALLIVPIKAEGNTVGVLELASFNKYEKHVINFVENLASNLATAISVTRNNEKTFKLLSTTQEQTEELKATEEEIRQNMEELQATQEQMSRKNEEMNELLEMSQIKEEMMKAQLEEFESLKNEEEELVESLEAYRSMMLDVLNELPYKVFLKDEEGKIFLANSKVAESHNMEIEDLIGKSDHDFVEKETADLWRKDELEIIKKGEETYVFEEDMGNGKRIMETIKKRFYIRPIKQIGLLGIQKDITEDADAQEKLKKYANNQKVK